MDDGQPQEVASHIGVGFFLEGKNDEMRFRHGGWDEGFVTEFVAYKNLGKGAVVMVNSNQGDPILREIIRAIALEYDWPGYFPEEKTYVKIDDHVLVKWVGTYQSESGLKGEVNLEDGQLLFTLKNQRICTEGLG